MVNLKRFKKDEDFKKLVKLYACRGISREYLENVRQKLSEKAELECKINRARQEVNQLQKEIDKEKMFKKNFLETGKLIEQQKQ
jgi:hypothetical protein